MRPLLDLLAPPRCLACRARAAPPWCARCAATLRPAVNGCPRCASPPRRGHACWPADAPVDATVAAFDYHGTIAASVVTAKLAGARTGWGPLARTLATRLAADPPDVDVVTWVTTPPRRVRERGVDHAQVLARAAGAALDRPIMALLVAEPVTVDRDRYHVGRALPGTNVLLVDDVLTTGATAWRAATALRSGGAGRIVLAVLARAGTHPLGATSPAAHRSPQPQRHAPRGRVGMPSPRAVPAATVEARPGDPASPPTGSSGRTP
jgi:predicted amidophosphoribosyltransferase